MEAMAERKSEVVNLRMSPRVKELLRLAAGQERRTLSNMLEVLIEDFCKHHGIQPARTPAPPAPLREGASSDASGAKQTW